MNIRIFFVILLACALVGISYLNWDNLSIPADVNLGFKTVHAPLGLIFLALWVLLCVLFLIQILWMQGVYMLQFRRFNKELQMQRELVDRAEASRFTELKEMLQAQHDQGQTALQQCFQSLEQRLLQRVDDSDNSTAAFLGEIEDRLCRTVGEVETASQRSMQLGFEENASEAERKPTTVTDVFVR